MTDTAIVLFAHGARDPDWALPLQRVRDAIRGASGAKRVELSFLDFMTPTLQDCAESLVTDGFRRLLIVPLFIAQGGHLKHDAPLILDALRAAHPAVDFELAGPVGEAESVVQAMAAHVLKLIVDPQK